MIAQENVNDIETYEWTNEWNEWDKKIGFKWKKVESLQESKRVRITWMHGRQKTRQDNCSKMICVMQKKWIVFRWNNGDDDDDDDDKENEEENEEEEIGKKMAEHNKASK